MLEELYQLKNRGNSITEFCEYIRQGIPSAVFGVNESFKNFLISQIDSPTVYVVKILFRQKLQKSKSMNFRAKKQCLSLQKTKFY